MDRTLYPKFFFAKIGERRPSPALKHQPGPSGNVPGLSISLSVPVIHLFCVTLGDRRWRRVKPRQALRDKLQSTHTVTTRQPQKSHQQQWAAVQQVETFQAKITGAMRNGEKCKSKRLSLLLYLSSPPSVLEGGDSIKPSHFLSPT